MKFEKLIAHVCGYSSTSVFKYFVWNMISNTCVPFSNSCFEENILMAISDMLQLGKDLINHIYSWPLLSL